MSVMYADKPKQPYEEKRYGYSFKDDLFSGDSIASVDSISVFLDPAGTDVTGTAMKPGTEQVDAGSKSISAVIWAGANGDTYKIRFRAVTTDGEKLEGDLTLPVAED